MHMPVQEWMNQWEMEEDLQYPSPEEYEPSLQENLASSEYDAAFGLEDALNLRRVIGDVCAATPPVLTVAMPWELPGIRLGIGEDEPIVPTPILYPVPIIDEEVSHSRPSHRVARVEHIRGSYHEVIDFKLTLEESEITASRWDRALEKWYLIFARGRSGWPRGHDIDTLVAQKGVAGLRSIFGNRSHNTVLKRANSIIRFIHWFTKTSFSVTPFPLQAYDVEGYVEFLQHLRQHYLASSKQSISAKKFWTLKQWEQSSPQRQWTWANWQMQGGRRRNRPECSVFKRSVPWRASWQMKRISSWTDSLQGVSFSHCFLEVGGLTSGVSTDIPLTFWKWKER